MSRLNEELEQELMFINEKEARANRTYPWTFKGVIGTTAINTIVGLIYLIPITIACGILWPQSLPWVIGAGALIGACSGPLSERWNLADLKRVWKQEMPFSVEGYYTGPTREKVRRLQLQAAIIVARWRRDVGTDPLDESDQLPESQTLRTRIAALQEKAQKLVDADQRARDAQEEVDAELRRQAKEHAAKEAQRESDRIEASRADKARGLIEEFDFRVELDVEEVGNHLKLLGDLQEDLQETKNEIEELG